MIDIKRDLNIYSFEIVDTYIVFRANKTARNMYSMRDIFNERRGPRGTSGYPIWRLLREKIRETNMIKGWSGPKYHSSAKTSAWKTYSSSGKSYSSGDEGTWLFSQPA